MLVPGHRQRSGWVPGDAAFMLEAVRDTLNRYTIDKQRIVAHGMGIGGQMAVHLGFNHRDLFRGVVATAPSPRLPATTSRTSGWRFTWRAASSIR